MQNLDRYYSSHSVPSSSSDVDLEVDQRDEGIEPCDKHSLEKIKSLSYALLSQGEGVQSISSPKERDLRRYGELAYRRYQSLSRCPISIDFAADKGPPQELAAYFLDRLTFAANLLLDDRPEDLDAMGLNGSSTHFLGAFVSGDYMASSEFGFVVASLPAPARTHLENIRDRFLALLISFQKLSSHFSVQSCANGENNLHVRSYLENLWQSELEESSELLFPLWWNVEKADHVSSHLFLAHVQKAKSRFRVINTFPNDSQGYIRTSRHGYQQHSSVSFQAEKVSRITKNLFAAFAEMTLWEGGKEEGSEEEAECGAMDRSMEILSKKCKKSSLEETPFSRLDLPFGYSCASSVYLALFNSLLSERFRELDDQVQQSLADISQVWMLGLKLYVLKNFQREAMFLGKETFQALLSSLEAQIHSIRSPELKEGLLCLFKDAVSGYGEIPGHCESPLE